MAARAIFLGASLLVTALAIPTPSASYSNSAWQYNGPAWLPSGQDLTPKLPQSQTNGGSLWGTFNAPFLPKWLDTSGEPMPQGCPWGGMTAGNTNPNTSPPETGVTRHYDFTIAEATIAPDGVQRSALLINGEFPGLLIEANWDDWIEVVVHNNLPNEGTSLHWHGLFQTATPWFDGVPAVSQCPIAPASTFTYRFKGDQYESSWYHSHYSAQYSGGIFGSLVIYGPHENADYDIDLGPVLLSDLYHKDYYSIVEDVMAPAAEHRPPPSSNNNLINGKMNYPCGSISRSSAADTSDASTCVRSQAVQHFSIDGYQLTVMANDFVPVHPYTTNHVTLGVGQRTDVIVEATGSSTDAVWMRSTISLINPQGGGGCSLNDGISPEAVAAIYYENANTNAVPTTTSTISQAELDQCRNDALPSTVPFYSLTPDPNPSTTQRVDIDLVNNGTHNVWEINGCSFRADFNETVLLDAKLGHLDFQPEWNVHNFGSNKSVRLVVYNHKPFGGHPMHLHGHNFFVLAEGQGTWDGTITNANNPQRRDTQLLAVSLPDGNPSYVVIQFDMNNPGVWPFHCHIAWHVSAGLYMNVLEQPDKIASEMKIPSIMAQTCRDWSAWTGDHVVDEIDSGL